MIKKCKIPEVIIFYDHGGIYVSSTRLTIPRFIRFDIRGTCESYTLTLEYFIPLFILLQRRHASSVKTVGSFFTCEWIINLFYFELSNGKTKSCLARFELQYYPIG